jgi:hypothetical protein
MYPTSRRRWRRLKARTRPFTETQVPVESQTEAQDLATAATQIGVGFASEDCFGNALLKRGAVKIGNIGARALAVNTLSSLRHVYS